MKVSFVIPVRNDARALERCLISVRRAGKAAAPAGIETEVVVIDNGSSDDSAEVGRVNGALVLVLANGKVAELRNLGAARSTGDLLAFVDADHEIVEGWVSAGANSIAEPGVGAVGALCFPPPASTWVQRLYDALRGHREGRQEVEWLGSGNLLVRREAFEQAGRFDVELETCEDVDLCNRLRSRGWRIISDARLRNIHYGDPATLGQLFRGELWRGRDNLTVTLRGPLSLRSLPSVILPIVGLGGLAVAAAGVILWPLGWGWLVGAGLLAILGLAALRGSSIVAAVRPRSPLVFGQAFAIALVYETARALALVVRVGHRGRPTALPELLDR